MSDLEKELILSSGDSNVDSGSDCGSGSRSGSDSDHSEVEDDIGGYENPPAGFDFDIMDIDDNDLREQQKEEEEVTEPSQNQDNDEMREETENPEKDVTFFKMFSTNSNDQDVGNEGSSGLVKVIIDKEEEQDEDANGNHNVRMKTDQEWDNIAEMINSSKRPLEYYYVSSDKIDHSKYESIAVEGETIYEFAQKFKNPTDYKLIDLKKFNSKIDLYFNANKKVKNETKRKRLSKKKRDGKIFKRERIKKWKEEMKLSELRLKEMKAKEYDSKKPSTKTKFGDSFKRRTTVSRNIAKPGSKPVFRTE